MLPNNPTDNRLETNKPTLQKNQGGSHPASTGTFSITFQRMI